MQRTKEASGITALAQMQAFVRIRTFLMYKKNCGFCFYTKPLCSSFFVII